MNWVKEAARKTTQGLKKAKEKAVNIIPSKGAKNARPKANGDAANANNTKEEIKTSGDHCIKLEGAKNFVLRGEKVVVSTKQWMHMSSGSEIKEMARNKFNFAKFTSSPRLTKLIECGRSGVYSAKSKVHLIWGLAKVELRPPSISEMKEAFTIFQGSYCNVANMRFLDYPMSLVLQNILVATEVAMWFFVGEIIGKNGLIGYEV